LDEKREFQDIVNRQQWKCACLNGNGDFLAAAVRKQDHHQIYLWNNFGHFLSILEGPKEGIEMIYWHPYLPLLVVLTSAGLIKIWQRNTTENWSNLAPNFKVTEENVIYQEIGDEFDMVNFE
jgi:WD40 repeat protein